MLSKIAAGKYGVEVVAVCLCGNAASIPLASHDRYGLPLGVVMCPSCGLARTTPRLAASALPAFYQDDYHALHQSITVPDPTASLYSAGQGSAVANYLRDLLPEGRIRLADVGCGTGQVLRDVQRALGVDRVTAVGCEYAAAFVDAGRSAGSDIRQGGPETLQELAPFDAVILSHVVEHFPHPVEDLGLIRGLGHDTTLFYVEVPGLLAIDRKPEYAYRFEQYVTLAHTFHFTLATLQATMTRAGFQMIRGDEHVRSVFRWDDAKEPAADPLIAVGVLESISRLNRIPNRVRSVLPLLKQHLAAAARRLPESVYRQLRRWTHR